MKYTNSLLNGVSFVFIGITLCTSFIFKAVILQLDEFSSEYSLFLMSPFILLVILVAFVFLTSKQLKYLVIVPYYWIAGVFFSLMGYVGSVLIFGLLIFYTQSQPSIEPPFILAWIVLFLTPFSIAYLALFSIDRFFNRQLYKINKFLLLSITCVSQVFAYAFWLSYSHWWFVN